MCIGRFLFPVSIIVGFSTQNARATPPEQHGKHIRGKQDTANLWFEDTQIRNILDEVEPGQFGSMFNESLLEAEEMRVLDDFRVLDGGVLAAIDGLWYHSSESISCEHCLHKTTTNKKTNEEVTTYYHTILAATIVRPGKTEVLPMMGEFIRNEDGEEKSNHRFADCERNAAKRWLTAHADEYRWLKPTLLGDDLFSKLAFLRGSIAGKDEFYIHL